MSPVTGASREEPDHGLEEIQHSDSLRAVAGGVLAADPRRSRRATSPWRDVPVSPRADAADGQRADRRGAAGAHGAVDAIFAVSGGPGEIRTHDLCLRRAVA